MKVQCQVSLGELVDKITILLIKKEKIVDENKLILVNEELSVLSTTLESLSLDEIGTYLENLKTVNSELWVIEDLIREKERVKLFDKEFIELARKVYITNDKRFEIKNKINEKFGSSIKEVKSYKSY
ncbi:MAG: hypothetical protein COW00_09195 [Bdellovibrio sp. CG12_big_fil_rev_8_21_14_0_65_39_13]|nr:MAG: hypothetical protein COW78_09265 [Bdellovibrio sp. CG22_combo_CG10-13_8_21_14_all_39_27]PIQ59797.1 MAG: hypothetical protein COW00_09195 [Bdellovibrio sp. CG12_big_fil_rev_8_21_14_0_65_39_13]PIR36175.1 MAG: hypothetical protein COV37_04195 [Bdellovibrio sp. CG11_big_fil_rev_8_21_14_0_20_39_38]